MATQPPLLPCRAYFTHRSNDARHEAAQAQKSTERRRVRALTMNLKQYPAEWLPATTMLACGLKKDCTFDAMASEET